MEECRLSVLARHLLGDHGFLIRTCEFHVPGAVAHPDGAEPELVLEAAIKQEYLPTELDELASTLGWSKKTSGSKTDAHELLVFYLTLRSGVLVAEARVAWAEEVMPILKKGKLPARSKTKAN